MQRDLRTYLLDIQGAINDIFEFTLEKSLEDYDASPIIQAAVERKLTIIGEALRQIRQRYPEETEAIGIFSSFVEFQSFLIWQYAVVDNTIVWEAVKLLPEFQEQLTRRLERLGFGDIPQR